MSEAVRRHAWVFQVLRDLQDYALANDLPGLAEKAQEALEVARAEMDGGSAPPDEDKGFRH